MKAAVKAITDGKSELGVRIVQLVRLLREGEPVIMSKRVADFATLREVIDEWGLFHQHDASWTAAHLALLRAVEIVIAAGLRVFAPQEMR